MLKVAVLTVYTDNLIELADTVIPNLKKYCDKQGYTLYNYNITGTDMYFGFKKMEMLINILEYQDVNVVLCLDLDTLITNHNIRIESFLDGEHDFYITKDVNGINAGSFIVKNSEWTRSFVNLIYSKRKEFECEQVVMDAFKDVHGNSSKIKILEHPSINSYLYASYGTNWGIIGGTKIEKPTHKEGEWNLGDFIVHLPGLTLERRLEIFKNLEKEIIL